MDNITVITYADVANQYLDEARKYNELVFQDKTTSGIYNFTSTTSGIPYSGTDGTQGLFNKIALALNTLFNQLDASKLNTLQTEIYNALQSLSVASYVTTGDLSGVRSSVLSGNKNGALTQTISGESVINAMGDYGIFKDSNNDGTADGVVLDLAQNEAVLNDSALYGFSQYAESLAGLAISPKIGLKFSSSGLSIGDVLYYVGYVEVPQIANVTSVDVRAMETITTTILTETDSFSVDSSYENWVKISGTITVTVASSLTQLQLLVRINKSVTTAGIPFKTSNFTVINLTNKYSVGLEPTESQSKLNFPTPFINIGHSTINQKITGINGEFELKEPYVLPKTKDGTETITIVKDNQNFVRPAHKKVILNGGLAWDGFLTSGTVISAYVDNLSKEEFLSLTSLSGDFVNNDFNFRMSTSISTTENSATYNATNSRLTLGILQSLAGTTQATYESYLNSNPVISSIALASSEYDTGLLDIPIKHLASIEGGTWENNSVILPSAITLTYPTNEASERESSQIAQNQITTTLKNGIIGEVNNTYDGAFLSHKQGIYTIGQRFIYDGAFVVNKLNTNKNDELQVQTNTILTYDGAFLKNKSEVEL